MRFTVCHLKNLLSGAPKGQGVYFCTRYIFFIFSVNMAENSVYLAAWQIWNGGLGSMEMMGAVLIALQSAILSVLLEWLYPIRNWKIESDLWHHPRKYIVPLIMLTVAGFIGMCPVGIWVLLCIVIAEVLSLPFITNIIHSRKYPFHNRRLSLSGQKSDIMSASESTCLHD